jgi:large subunit ribosomal protein L25
MKSLSMSGSLRENVGKRDAKEQRAKGLVPCVLYGGEQQLQFVVEEQHFRKLLYTPEVLFVELTVGNKVCNAIVQDTQFHPITDKLLHVDFLEVKENKPIIIELPIRISGTSPGVLRGGKLSKKVRKLRISGLLKDIPEFINVDISNLEIGESIRISNINIDKIKFLEPQGKIVVTVLTTRNVEAATTNNG